MVLTRDELMNRIKEVIGDGVEDRDIALMEDIADTYDDLNTKITDDTDWKTKYDELEEKSKNDLAELDRGWREKYIARFNGNVEKDSDFLENPKDSDETILEYEMPKTYEELFEVGE